MKKILIMSIVGLCAINIFAASTNAFRVALAEARTNGKVAVLALLPQATNTLMLSRVYGTAVALTPKNDRPAYVASIPMSSIDATTTLTIQMLACPASSNVNAQLMAYCSSKSCRVNLWTSFIQKLEIFFWRSSMFARVP